MRTYDSRLTKIINHESDDLQLIWLENNNMIDGVSEKHAKQIISEIKRKRDLLSKVIRLEISFEETFENSHLILNRLAIMGKIENINCNSFLVTKFVSVNFYPNETLIQVMNGDIDKIINYIISNLIEFNSISVKILN